MHGQFPDLEIGGCRDGNFGRSGWRGGRSRTDTRGVTYGKLPRSPAPGPTGAPVWLAGRLAICSAAAWCRCARPSSVSPVPSDDIHAARATPFLHCGAAVTTSHPSQSQCLANQPRRLRVRASRQSHPLGGHQPNPDSTAIPPPDRRIHPFRGPPPHHHHPPCLPNKSSKYPPSCKSR